MEFLHMMVRVRDIAQSLKFYCDGLGLQQVRRSDYETGRFTLVFLASPADIARANSDASQSGFVAGIPILELTHNWPDGGGASDIGDELYDGGRNFGHLAYQTNDIYALCQHLIDMGVVINRPPRDGHMAFVRSPDNISIELLQEGDALEPADPWASMENTGHW